MSTNEAELGGQRIPQAHGRSDGRVDPGPVRLQHQVAGGKLRQQPPHPNVDGELRQDEEQREEKPRVDFRVEEKWTSTSPTRLAPPPSRAAAAAAT